MIPQVSDFQTISISIEETCNQSGISNHDIARLIEQRVQTTREILDELNGIIQTQIVLNYRDVEDHPNVKLRISWKNWTRKQNEIQILTTKLRESKELLGTNLTVLTAYAPQDLFSISF